MAEKEDGLVISDVTLEEIRETDKAQRYSFPYVEGMGKQFKLPCNSLWLIIFDNGDSIPYGDFVEIVKITKYQRGN